MAVATTEQIQDVADAVVKSEARPLLERLKDPQSHSPVKLRADALERIAELEAALRDLHNECEQAGHDRDLDYGWPRVMAAAKSALNK